MTLNKRAEPQSSAAWYLLVSVGFKRKRTCDALTIDGKRIPEDCGLLPSI